MAGTRTSSPAHGYARGCRRPSITPTAATPATSSAGRCAIIAPPARTPATSAATHLVPVGNRLKQRIDQARFVALLPGITTAVLAVAVDQSGGLSTPRSASGGRERQPLWAADPAVSCAREAAARRSTSDTGSA